MKATFEEGRPMSNVTKEWLQQKIAEMEEHRDLFPGDLDDDHASVLSAFRIALASLEAEPVSVPDEEQRKPHPVMAVKGELGFLYHFERIIDERDDDIEIGRLSSSNGEALMLAALDAFRASIQKGVEPVTIKANGGGYENDEPPERGWVVTHSGKDYFYREQGDAATHMNAAVESGIGVSLRSFIPEPVTTAYKLPGDFESFISWLTSGDGIPDWLINGDKLDDEKVSFLLKVYRAGSRDANGKKGEGIFVYKSSEMSVSGITIGESQCRNSPVIPDCSCRTCRPVTFSDSRFVVCPECGNKRCPHANDHRNACTGSNEPGQEGSAYPAAPQQEVNNGN